MLLLIYGHFMRQTPFSLLVLPSYAWRTEGRKDSIAIVEQLKSHVGRIADNGLMSLIPDRKVVFAGNMQGLGVAANLRIELQNTRVYLRGAKSYLRINRLRGLEKCPKPERWVIDVFGSMSHCPSAHEYGDIERSEELAVIVPVVKTYRDRVLFYGIMTHLRYP